MSARIASADCSATEFPILKWKKWVIDRRLKVLEEEGIEFKTSVAVGADVTKADLEAAFDASGILRGGHPPRDLPLEGT